MNGSRVRGRSLGLIATAFLVSWAPSGELAAQQGARSRPDALARQHPYPGNLLDALEAGRRLIYAAVLDPTGEPTAETDLRLYNHLIREGLANPDWPAAISSGEDAYATDPLAPSELLLVFDRLDGFHRDLLNAFTEPDTAAANRAVEALVTRYLSETSTALSPEPKDMAIMEEGAPAGAFRQAYPHLHGLIWAHRWLELALFEPLMRQTAPESRHAGMIAVAARFWSMLEEPPRGFPTQMPMAPTIARTLVARHPQAAAILENGNMLRDMATDILLGEAVADRAEALRIALARFQDPAFRQTSWYEWNRMAIIHGVGNQGGQAVNIIPDPEQTEVHMNHHHGRHIMSMPPGGM